MPGPPPNTLMAQQVAEAMAAVEEERERYRQLQARFTALYSSRDALVQRIDELEGAGASSGPGGVRRRSRRASRRDPDADDEEDDDDDGDDGDNNDDDNGDGDGEVGGNAGEGGREGGPDGERPVPRGSKGVGSTAPPAADSTWRVVWWQVVLLCILMFVLGRLV